MLGVKGGSDCGVLGVLGRRRFRALGAKVPFVDAGIVGLGPVLRSVQPFMPRALRFHYDPPLASEHAAPP